MRTMQLLVAVLATSLAAPSQSAAQATLIDGLGGIAGFGEYCLHRNDDGSSLPIDLTATFPSGFNYFGPRYTSVFVNTNGTLSFGAGASGYNASRLELIGRPVIAGYYADMDLRASTAESCEATESPGMCSASTGTAEIFWSVTPARAVFTWNDVGRFNCRADRVMTFQIILTRVGVDDANIEFRYARCEWTVGDRDGNQGFSTPRDVGCSTDSQCGFQGLCVPPESLFIPGDGDAGPRPDAGLLVDGGQRSFCYRGIPAQIGLSGGTVETTTPIPGSRLPNVHITACSGSNVQAPGVWRFEIRHGVVATCLGSGAPCTTPLAGACAEGVTTCMGTTPVCSPMTAAEDETCDGVDNDCDGATDDGSLCASPTRCRTGECVTGCGTCASGTSCDAASGACVARICVGVTCATGEVCAADGSCVRACDGVTCPSGQICSDNRCVDPCAEIACGTGSVCVAGACQPRCTATSCDAGLTCDAYGRCAEASCQSVSCAIDERCVGGTCVSRCTGVVCPHGEVCTAGRCVVPEPDAGAPETDAGTSPVDAHVSEPDAAEPDGAMRADVDASTTRDASSGFDAGVGSEPATMSSNSGCRAATPSSQPGFGLLAGLFALHRRMRRRRSATRAE